MAKAKLKRSTARVATKVPAKALPSTTGDLLEIGARVIYGFKRDPKKNPWETAAGETRASYRARMRELLNELATAGFVVRR